MRKEISLIKIDLFVRNTFKILFPLALLMMPLSAFSAEDLREQYPHFDQTKLTPTTYFTEREKSSLL